MKLTAILLLAAAMQVSANGHAQTITLTARNASLQKLFTEIEKQTGYNFVYTDDLLEKAKKVDVDIKIGSLEQVLAICFKDQPLTYNIVEKVIVVKQKPNDGHPELVSGYYPQQAPAALIDVHGRVINDKGEPVAGATVKVKGLDKGTSTNENGEFTLTGIDANSILVISGTNIETFETRIDGKTDLATLTVKTKVTAGQEVIVSNGYQEIDKTRATGSFVKIDNSLFNRQVGPNVIDRILNVTSGLVAVHNNGIAGLGGSGILIRGVSTINAGKEPLIVVDNFPYDGDLNNLNPNDVESITVLKDAAAASIWGVRAANGVIVVTTKRGKYNQKSKIQLSSNLTIGAKPDLNYIPSLSSKDMVDFEKTRFSTGVYNDFDDLYPSFQYFPVLPKVTELLLAVRRGAISQTEANAQISGLEKNDVKEDISKYLLQSSINQQYSLNISGGSENYSYFGSLGYDKNRDINIGREYNRISANFSNSYRPVKNLEISGFITYTQTVNHIGSGLSFSSFLPVGSTQVSPYTRLADDNGTPLVIPKNYRQAYIDTAHYPALVDWNYRPLSELKYTTNDVHQFDVRLGINLKYTIIKGLIAEFQYQNQKNITDSRNDASVKSYRVRDLINQFMGVDATGKVIYPFPVGDFLNLSMGKSNSWNYRGEFRFDGQFKDHQVNALAGAEIREATSEINLNSLYGYDPLTYTSIAVNPTIDFPLRPGGTSGKVGGENIIGGTLMRFGSVFTNLAYNFKKRYSLTASGRIDQSNFFGVDANLRKVPLWSSGLSWDIAKENFYKIRSIPSLRLRATYGYNGNTNAGASSFATIQYLTNPLTIPTNATFANLLTPPNPDLRWERVRVLNFGLDFEMFNSILFGSIDYYQKKGLDLLGPISTDPTSGFQIFTGNKASLKNRGLDVLLNSNVINKSFKWNTSLKVSYNTEKVTSYEGTPPGINSQVMNGGVIVGKPLFSLYSYRWAGLDPSNGDPRIYLSDTISKFSNYFSAKSTDLVYAGQLKPTIFGSFLNTFSYKNISVSANLIYKFGYFFRRNSVNFASLLSTGWGGHNDFLLRWQKPGDELITNVPSMPKTSDSRDNVYSYSNILVEKGDHIRLQDIRISYELNTASIRKLPLDRLQFYVYLNNLGIIWRANKLGLDPDAYEFGNVPRPRSISFGIRSNF